MSEERHETLADNVSANHQFREVAKMIPHEEVAVSKMETTTPTSEKSSAGGNSAAMREALESVRNWCLNRLFNSSHQVTVEGLLSVVNAALSAPPRNCDVGTEEEQRDRLEDFCSKYFRYSADNPCSGCPIHNGDSMPFVYRFLQMPYEDASETKDHSNVRAFRFKKVK